LSHIVKDHASHSCKTGCKILVFRMLLFAWLDSRRENKGF
jgi:hypothetical protein